MYYVFYVIRTPLPLGLLSLHFSFWFFSSERIQWDCYFLSLASGTCTQQSCVKFIPRDPRERYTRKQAIVTGCCETSSFSFSSDPRMCVITAMSVVWVIRWDIKMTLIFTLAPFLEALLVLYSIDVFTACCISLYILMFILCPRDFRSHIPSSITLLLY